LAQAFLEGGDLVNSLAAVRLNSIFLDAFAF
jgi:hypothetical protein